MSNYNESVKQFLEDIQQEEYCLDHILAVLKESDLGMFYDIDLLYLLDLVSFLEERGYVEFERDTVWYGYELTERGKSIKTFLEGYIAL